MLRRLLNRFWPRRPRADGEAVCVDAETTSAFAQYVPAGVPGIPPTPGCVTQPNGHFCAQSAAESELQRSLFFQSALSDPAPMVVNPFDP